MYSKTINTAKKIVKLDLNLADLLLGISINNKMKNNVNIFQKNHSTPKGVITECSIQTLYFMLTKYIKISLLHLIEMIL